MPHAILSPSSAHRWMRCTGSVNLADSLPAAPSSIHAAEGTFCHEIAALCLTHSLHAPHLVGTKLAVEGHEFTLDADTADEIQAYVDAVRTFAAGGRIYVEQKVPLAPFTGETGAEGTADAIVVAEYPDGKELQVHDLKMGRGVEVHAEDNEQLMLYALGAGALLGPLAKGITQVRGFIHQPRISRDPKVAVYSLDQLAEFGKRVGEAASQAVNSPRLSPGDKQCRFCPAKAICPELAAHVQDTIGAMFTDITATALPAVPVSKDELRHAMDAVDAIEKWCLAVRAEVERILLSGAEFPGYKLVMGRRGARKWTDEAAVGSLLTTALGDDAYTRSLLSVAAAEKKAAKAAPEVWQKVVPLITQSPGSPSVAPETDPRPAYSIAGVADGFSTVKE